jgi:hypothetical protein
MYITRQDNTIGIAHITQQCMARVLNKDYTNSEVFAEFETFGRNTIIADKFFLQLYASANYNSETFRYLLQATCGSMVLAIKIDNYLRSNYKKEIFDAIAAIQQQKEQERIAERKDSIKEEQAEKLEEKQKELEREDSVKEASLAMEKYERENQFAKFSMGDEDFVSFVIKSGDWQKCCNYNEIHDETFQLQAIFFVNRNGTVDMVDINNNYSRNEKLENEIIRVLKLTKWSPALKDSESIESEKVLTWKGGDKDYDISVADGNETKEHRLEIDASQKQEEEEKLAKEKYEKENTIAKVEGMDNFQSLLSNYVYTNLSDILNGNIEGSFTIEKDGTVGDIKMNRNNENDFTLNDILVSSLTGGKQRIKRYIKSLKWAPALENNITINSYENFTIEIHNPIKYSVIKCEYIKP